MPPDASRKEASVATMTTAIATADRTTDVARGEIMNPKSNLFDIMSVRAIREHL